MNPGRRKASYSEDDIEDARAFTQLKDCVEYAKRDLDRGAVRMTRIEARQEELGKKIEVVKDSKSVPAWATLLITGSVALNATLITLILGGFVG